METDCVPAKADWVTDLDAICRREPFWIAGAFLHDLGAVNGDYAFHLNGTALSATGDQGFQEFLESTFIPALTHLLLERGAVDRSEERRVGNEWVSMDSTGWT